MADADFENEQSFNVLITSKGLKKTTLIISDEKTVTSDITVPSNVKLVFLKGGALNIPRGMSVTLNSSVEAGLYQIFSGLGEVFWGRNAVPKVYPQWWGAVADGDKDDTTAVQRAINSVVRRGGGTILFANGIYLINSLSLHSNVNIMGNGWKSIIKQKSGAQYGCSINPGDGGTVDTSDNEHDINISNIQFRGTVEIDGFSAHMHLLNINAATNVHVSNCKFVGWRGDGIYIGSSNMPRTERHNKRIVIENSTFDGLNHDNRNAITVIDGDGVVINKNHFVNCTRPDMPGAVDIEPNADSFAVIKNIKIIDNHFQDIGGNAGIISIVLSLGQKALKRPSDGILIEGNTIENRISSTARRPNGLLLYQVQNVDETTWSNNIIVSRNSIKNVDRPFQLLGVKGVKFLANTFDNSLNAGLVSYRGNYKCRNIDFVQNIFRELGISEGIGIAVYEANHISFINNVFDNIGRPTGASGIAIDFKKDAVDWVRIEDNQFIGERITTAIQDKVISSVAPEHKKIINNRFYRNNGANSHVMDRN